jgi:hypothetical protein
MGADEGMGWEVEERSYGGVGLLMEVMGEGRWIEMEIVIRKIVYRELVIS